MSEGNCQILPWSSCGRNLICVILGKELTLGGTLAEPIQARQLAESEGFASVEELLEACVHDSVNPGICTREDCDYTCEVEPDQDRGWCEECKAPTVKPRSSWRS